MISKDHPQTILTFFKLLIIDNRQSGTTFLDDVLADDDNYDDDDYTYNQYFENK
jgi:hypothetical protein